MTKLSQIGLILTMMTVLSTARAEVNPQSIIQIFQRLETLEKKGRELHGENEVLRHQIDQLKKSQKKVLLNIDSRIDQLSNSIKTTQNTAKPQVKTEAKVVENQTTKDVPNTPAPVTNIEKPKQPVAPIAPKPETANTDTSNNKTADSKSTEKNTSATNSTAPKKSDSREPTSYEKETYQAAFNKMNGSPSAATRAFKEYIKMQPDSPLAANAQYWIGEIMYSHNNYKGAVEEFIQVLQKYKYSSKAPDAAIKLGYSFYALKNWKYARRTFEDVLKYFPENKNAVKLAKKRLDKMKLAGN
ncbi:MAG: tol-pal system protein YbgF [Cocleimonas sp.]